jgi:histidine ammonia-lyase
MTVVVNTRDDFTLANFRRVSYDGEPVRLGDHARRALAAGHHRAAPELPSGDSARRDGQAADDAAAGRHLEERVVRGTVFACLAGWVTGETSVPLATAERAAALLGGALPRMPPGGQAGMGEAACAAALAADTALQARHRLEHAEAVCALSIEAFGAPLGAYDQAVDELWGDGHETAALEALRRHLDGAGSGDRRFHQPPVSYRIIPRVLGQAQRAVAGVEKAAAVSLRSVTGDILYLGGAAGGPAGRVLCTGGFYNGLAYPAMNALSAAWADLALVAERQVTALNTAETSGLPVNLGVPGAARSGTYAYGWAASGYVEEARAAATPALLPVAVSDPHADALSPTLSAYRRQRRAAECLDGVLAILIVVSSQALFVTGRSPAEPLRPLLSFGRSVFPPIDGTGERDLSADGGRLQQALGAAALTGRLVATPAPPAGSR